MIVKEYHIKPEPYQEIEVPIGSRPVNAVVDDKILDDTFLDCMRKNINPFIVMREAREEYEKIPKTNRRHEWRN
jgi:hypothetical protein